MLVELRKRSNHGKLVQEATVQKYLTVVSAVLSDAKRNEIIPENPAHMIDLPDTEKREQFIPSEEEQTGSSMPSWMSRRSTRFSMCWRSTPGAAGESYAL